MNAAQRPAIRVVSGVPSGEVSAPQYSTRTIHDVLTPMRDGVHLAMDLLRPEATGPFPVILHRTPYDKVSYRANAFYQDLARRGYLVAIQDCRGRYNSDGVFDPYRHEHDDGFDTVEWIAAQSWCDGHIGMVGGSYDGQTQWFAASRAPRALKAIVPTVSPPGHPFMNEPLYGGVMIMGFCEFMHWMGRRSFRVAGLGGVLSQHQEYFEALPLSKLEARAGTDCRWWQESLQHPCYDEFWKACGYEQDWSRMTVPALNIGGWWDLNFLGAPRNFVGMRAHGATPQAREGQRLVLGPWPHHVNKSRSLNGVDFGATAVTGLDHYTLRFFDYWLRGFGGLAHDARVHVFVIGANEWWEADDWPFPGTQTTELYLHSDGHANTHRGDGRLSRNRPGEEPCDAYDSDPLDPIRVTWSLHDGCVDDRSVTARPDVLCYSSEVLEQPMDVVGPVKAVVYASSSARDCDWHLRLVDVHPDGAARFLCHGALRARFREGFERAVFLEPGRIERFEIDMTAVGVRFLPGHRIRLEIASSWFSRFERNPQTGAGNWMTDEQPPIIARQKIFHDAGHPSHVLLPLIRSRPRREAQASA